MTAKGWIERLEHPGHRRILMTRLTKAGEALLGDCETAVDALETRLLMGLSADDVERLRRSLGAIITASP